LISGIKLSKVLQVALVHMLGVPAFAWHNAKLESVLLGGCRWGDWKGLGLGGFWHVNNSKLNDLEKGC